MTSDKELLKAVRADPDWRIFRGRRPDGRLKSWVASRRQEEAGRDATVIAETAGGLRTALVEQHDRRADLANLADLDRW